ncbi:MAG: HAMP domain-containing protein [Bacteroidetes bacterium]|nr:MAG: HAMP domain-containing protein [Bacteroidota bacterium]
MKKRQLVLIGVIFSLFSLALGMDFIFTKERNLSIYAEKIEDALQHKESQAEAFLSDTVFIVRQYRGFKNLSSTEQQELLQKEKALSTAPFNLCLYEGDSLIFWAQNRAFLNEAQLRVFSAQPEFRKIFLLPNGYYYALKKTFDFPGHNRYGIALIPVRNNYALESEHLQNQFLTEGRYIPKEIVFSEKPTPFVLHAGDGTELGWITNEGDFHDITQLKWILLIYLLGFIALGVLINDFAIQLVRKYRPWVGAAFLISTIFIIRYVTIKYEFTNNFKDLVTFADTFSKPVLNSSSSLGDLLINIVLLLWTMVFFHREFQVQKFLGVSRPVRYALTTFNYFSVILGLIMILGVFKSLVLDSDIAFDFDNVLNLNVYSILAIFGIILLILALFLFSHRMMLTIAQIGLGKYPRIAAFTGAVVASLPFVYLSDLNISMVFFLLSVVIYVWAFDLFIEHKSPNLTWLVIWLVLFSLFSSIALFKYNNDRDLQTRIRYAYELANLRDSLAEESFQQLHPKIAQSPGLQALTQTKTRLSKDDLNELVNQPFSEDKYLFHNYAFNAEAFYMEDGTPVSTEILDSLEQLRRFYNQARQTAHAGLRYHLRMARYFMRTELPGPHPVLLFMEFKHKSSNPSKVYAELLLNQQYKDLRNLDQYDYAIYKKGVLVESKGAEYEQYITEALPPVGQWKELVHSSKRSELIYHAPDNIVVQIGKDMGTYLKPISLFSYLFGLLILTVLLLSLINSVTHVLPEALHFSFSKTPSLRNRIQFAVISLILVSFLIIGLVSVWHFRNSSSEYHQGRLERKVHSIRANVEQVIEQQYKLRGGVSGLEDLVVPLSDIHRLDVNIYDLHGNLISSSEQDVFRKGILAPKMGGFAYQSVHHVGRPMEVQLESIGDLQYQSAYIPLTDPEGHPLAYIGVPYYSQLRDLQNDVSEFMGALLNVYVFLLLIAGGIAIAVANSITKPISDLGDSLKRLKLGRNEPLLWESKDELGELIAEYNRMIKKLEESTDLLAQSEREGAWREMAKQVAHEIKNPLTPMKLSIQYMLHAYQSNPANIGPLIERVSRTLIEQIDSLAQIASEFSNFAKMPQAQNTKFLLNDLVISVHNLFANERQDMDISLFTPDRAFYVYADKKHLTRVLNNLIKNAIQAIPDERKGRIEIHLNQKDDRVVIKVSDNGVGISEEMRNKVFVPNFTTKNSGTGLGLAISKNIIEAVHGKIYFHTEVGHGTDFFVELPLIDVEEIQEVQ